MRTRAGTTSAQVVVAGAAARVEARVEAGAVPTVAGADMLDLSDG